MTGGDRPFARALAAACAVEAVAVATARAAPAARDEQDASDGTGRDARDESIEWFAGACVTNRVDLAAYIRWAERLEDDELAEFFRPAVAKVHPPSVMRRPGGLTCFGPR
jgi:hypothetical protein